MADYNVNMKQWNGTSFDNVLPLAYNANQLGGQSLTEVKQWVQDNNLLLYTGQYTGTGTYGASNPVSIQFPFEPKLFIFPISILHNARYPISTPLDTGYLTTSYKQVGRVRSVSKQGNVGGDYLMARFSDTQRTELQIYSTSSAVEQGNESSIIYYFAAIGGYDMGRLTEWLITSSGPWTVPKTGRYMLELYGGGGGTSRSSSSVSGYSGGASCQHYDSVSLVARNNIDIVVGSGVKGQGNGGSTSFGSYSVSGGGGSSDKVAGAGAGNYGAIGKFQDAHTTERNYGSGVFSELYGCGASNALNKSGDGAVYIKYIGE